METARNTAYNAQSAKHETPAKRPDETNVHVSFTDLIRSDLKDYCPASNLAFNEKIKALIKEGKKVYHFGFGQAPFPVFDGMVRGLREYAEEKAYLAVAGLPELREAICDFHRRHDNLTGLHADQVIVGPGSKELIFLLLNVFQGAVLVTSPSWTTYKPQSQLAHHSPYVVESRFEDEWRVTPDAIEKTIKDNKLTGNKVMIICNPDNPTGTSYKGDHLKAISDVCRRNKIIIISDEIYARLHYTQKHDSLARYYPEGTVLSTGFSKWASAGGWRLGYHIFPPELKTLKDAVRSAASHTYSCAAAPVQYAVAKALKNEEGVDSYILHTTRIMATVADYCYRELTAAGVTCIMSSGGYYIFPNFAVLKEPMKKRGITTGSQLCDVIFDEINVALMAGGPAFLRPADEFTIRLCFVNFDGKDGLEESRRVGLDTPLGDEFLKQYCCATYEGIQVLKKWVITQVQQNK